MGANECTERGIPAGSNIVFAGLEGYLSESVSKPDFDPEGFGRHLEQPAGL
jgi:hypothetical protein